MKHLNTPTPSPNPVSREEAQALLRAELDVEAAAADDGLAAIYAFLIGLADAGRTIPARATQPNLLGISNEMGIRRLKRGFPQARVVERWHARFVEAYGTDEERERLRTPELPALHVPSGDQGELPDDLRRARAEAPDSLHFAYDWLIARATAGDPMPMFQSRPNLRLAAMLMEVPYDRALRATDLFEKWAPRFEHSTATTYPLRTRLPGSEHVGTELPTETLVAAMQLARSATSTENEGGLLDHLIKVALGDRKLPRWNDGLNYSSIFKHPGVAANNAGARSLGDWAGFFHLDEITSYRTNRGETRVKPRTSSVVIDLIEKLRAADHTRLQRSRYRPKQICREALEQETGQSRKNFKIPAIRAILLGYVEECRHHFGEGDGLGETYRPGEGEQAAIARFRDGLTLFAKEELDAGRRLPSLADQPNRLDYGELVRRYGRSGPDLSHDEALRARIKKLQPRFAPLDRTRAPTTWGELLADYTLERLKRTTTPGSRKATKSKVKSVIEAFCAGIDATLKDEVGDALGDGFKATLDTIVAMGGISQPTHWKGDMAGVREFHSRRSAEVAEEESFSSVLLDAILADGRPFSEVAEQAGLEHETLRNWVREVSAPSRNHKDEIAKLEATLAMDEGRLADLLDSSRISRKQKGAVKIPKHVKEFLPDDYAKRSPGELQAMIAWIQDNLLRQNTAFARMISAKNKERHADRKKTDKIVAAATPATPESMAAVKKALSATLAHETEGLGRGVVEELGRLVDHMTSFLPEDLDRRPGAHWKEDSTAPMKIAMITRFLKWQTVPEDDGGLGRKPDDLTLADIVNPALAFAFVDYNARRNAHYEHDGRRRGKRFTSSDVDLVQTFGSLVAATYGFVWQSPELARRIVADERVLANGSFVDLKGHVFTAKENKAEEEREMKAVSLPTSAVKVMPADQTCLSPADFRSACEAAARKYASAKVQLRMHAQSGRDPAEPIQGLLDRKRPMEALLRQFALASQKLPSLEGNELRHHAHVRDLLLCRLLALTTLRNRNIDELTVGTPASKLRLVPADPGAKAGTPEAKARWLLEIHYSEFKNFRSAVLFGRFRKRQNYRKYLPDTQGLYTLLDYYLKRSRPYLLRNRKEKDLDRLFVSARGYALTRNGVWRVTARFTARHVAWNPFRNEGLPKVMPFGPHAFRDLRATDILLNPRTANPYLEAALAIQTSPEMVQASYGIIKVERRTAEDDLTFLASERGAWQGIVDEATPRLRLAA